MIVFIQNCVAYLQSHKEVLVGASGFILSEVIAIIQYFKFPTNSGFGGFVVGAYKLVQSIGQALGVPPSSPPPAVAA